VAEFRKYDLNRDGFITQEEAVKGAKLESLLKWVKGAVNYKGKLETAEEGWHGKKAWAAYTVELEKGRTYKIEMMSKTLFCLIVLETPDGKIVAFNNSGGMGVTAHFTYRTLVAGAYRIIVTTQDGIKTGEFNLTVREYTRTDAKPALPEWFKKLDTDGDGQVSLAEWKAGGRTLAEARKYDLDRNGFITPDEAIKVAELESRLKFVKGWIRLKGKVENNDVIYQGRRAYTSYKVELERGRSYKIEMVSDVYYAYLFLVGPDGKILAQHDSGGNGLTSRIVHRAKKTGVYRIIATSLGGFRTGDFNLTIRERPTR
jgi:hypothetical protein